MLLQNREDNKEIQTGTSRKIGVAGTSAARPRMAKVPALDDASGKEAVSRLRRFHLGDPTAAGLCDEPDDSYLPALLNPYRSIHRFRYTYPVILPAADDVEDGRYVIPLDDFLRAAVESFAPGESGARILKDNLAWLERWLRERMSGVALPCRAADLLHTGADALREHLNLSGSNQASFDADLDKLEACLAPKSLVLALGPNTAFFLLHHVMQCRRAQAGATFRERLETTISGLTRLLAVEREKTSAGKPESVAGMGEGGRYLNPAGFSGMVAHRHEGSVSMSPDRRERVMKALTVLQSFSQDEGDILHLVLRPGSLTLEESTVFRIIESVDPCREAVARYDKLARAFAGVFTSMRIADLELANKYDPAVHDTWFENFDWEAFSDEELRLVPTVVAVETTDHAAGDCMPSVSRLLGAGKPVQLAMMVSAHGDPERTGKEMFHGFRTELAWFGIGHREAVVNQVSISRVDSLVAGFESALSSTRPSLHLIHTGFTPSQPLHPWIMASAALESRAHPYLRFNPVFVEGGGIDFADNPSPEDDWSVNEFACADDQGEMQTLQLAFTFADYCLLKPDLRGEFRVVPQGLRNDDLVTVDEYLAADDAARKSMIPYLWSVDGANRVQQLVISRALAFACRDRLNFWRELQSRAGVHNYYVDRAVTETRAEEQAIAAEARDALLQAHAEEMERVRDSAAQDIMGRLTEVLLGLDLSDAAIRGTSRSEAPVSVSPVAEAAEPIVEESEVAPPASEQQEEEEAISFNEPWSDTMLCTSCDDCMAINKVMFVYNEDKQMVISDPRTGTYEQLVKAAELCPARCIHPGKPLNPDEPGLDALIKRAEPYN